MVHLFYRLTILKGGFTLKSVSVGDFRFSYIERGDSKKAEHVILMVHGFTGDKGVWCLMGDVLPKSYHLLAVDLPGHGYTTRKHHDDHSIPAQVAKLHQVANEPFLDCRYIFIHISWAICVIFWKDLQYNATYSHYSTEVIYISTGSNGSSLSEVLSC